MTRIAKVVETLNRYMQESVAARDKLNKFIAKLNQQDADVQVHFGSCYDCMCYILGIL